MGVARREAGLAEVRRALANVYTPATPIDDPKLFSGRTALLDGLEATLGMKGSHVLLYGERGVGKTSLWQVLVHGRKVARHSASAGDDFVSIFFRVLEKLGEQFTPEQRKEIEEISGSFGADKVASVSSKVGVEEVTRPVAHRTLDLNFVLDRVAGRGGDLDVIVIDEFQSITRPEVQTQIIEVIKGFSDRKVDVTIVIVGVADSDDELLSSREYRQYKGRHIFAHRVPRMTAGELREIIDVRERMYEVTFDDGVKTALCRIAAGYPSTAHRLALLAAQAWTRRAVIGHAANAVLWLVRVSGLPFAFTVKKANVHVEEQDLRRAVELQAEEFREGHPELAECYENLRGSPRREEVERLIGILADSPTARVRTDKLAERAGLERRPLELLIVGHAKGLVESVDGDSRLTVRHLRTYVEALRYLN